MEPVTAIGNIADNLFTSDEERLTHAEVMERIKQQPHMIQAETNKIAAQSRHWFVAAARPSILWACSTGLWFSFVINPLIQWYTGEPGPVLPMDYIMEMTIGMLGLAGLRTYEKRIGVTK